MKKLIAVQLLILISINGFSWGATGHRVTGWVAEQHLSKKAKKEIDRILGGQSLAMASNWMDEIRSDSLYNYAEDWHFVTIPTGMTYQATTKNPSGYKAGRANIIRMNPGLSEGFQSFSQLAFKVRSLVLMDHSTLGQFVNH